MAEDNLTNLMNQLKGMMGTNGNSNTDSNHAESNNSSKQDFSITPAMINQLASMIQANPTGSENSSSAENSSSSAESNSSSNFSNSLDFETILKIKTMMEAFTKKDDPRSNLLYSLKPYLRESRQKKLDQYVNLFKITQVTNLFKHDKGDEN